MIDNIQAAQRLDLHLSRFDPLPRIMFYDDFSQGMSGWTSCWATTPGACAPCIRGYRQFTPPMLSNLTQWDGGTHGA